MVSHYYEVVSADGEVLGLLEGPDHGQALSFYWGVSRLSWLNAPGAFQGNPPPIFATAWNSIAAFAVLLGQEVNYYFFGVVCLESGSSARLKNFHAFTDCSHNFFLGLLKPALEVIIPIKFGL